MGVQVDGHAHVFLELLYQGVSVIGQQQVGHVLDADGVSAHLLQLHAELDKIVLAVHRALGVADGHLGKAAVLLHKLYRCLDVPGVVQSIENTHHINAVLQRLLNKGLYHIVSVMAVAQKVLAPQQHLQLGVGQALFQGAQALPGVFVQKAHAHVKGSAAPAFQGPVANAVQKGQHLHHVLQLHAGSRLRLVGVAQNGIHYLKGIFSHNLPYASFSTK